MSQALQRETGTIGGHILPTAAVIVRDLFYHFMSYQINFVPFSVMDKKMKLL